MITLRFAGPQSGDLKVLGTAGLSGSFDDTHGMIGASVTLYLPAIGETLAAVEEVVQLGSLIQGNLSWGRLHDKEVSHFHVDGFIDLSHYRSLVHEEWPNANDDYVLGWVTPVGSHIVGPLCEFGKPLSLNRSYTIPGGHRLVRGFDGVYRDYYSEPTVQRIEDRCVADGNVHVAISRYMGVTHTITGDPPITASVAPKYIAAYVILRTVVNGTYQYRIRSLTDVGHDNLVDPDGNVYDSIDRIPLSFDYWYDKTAVSGPTGSYSDLITDDEAEYPLTPNELISRAKQALEVTFPQVISLETPEFDPAELTKDILDQHVVTSGLLLDAFQLDPRMLADLGWKNFSTIIEAFKDAFGSASRGLRNRLIRDLKKILKTGSGTYLGVKYGILPNLRDLEDVWQSGKAVAELRNSSSRLHSRHNVVGTPAIGSLMSLFTMTVEVDYLARDFLPLPDQLLAAWHRFGMWPDLTMAWDTVPFSFVVDWFAHVDEATRALDARIWRGYYPIKHCIQGKRTEWEVACKDLWPDIGCLGDSLTFVSYSRTIGDELPYPPIFWTGEYGKFNHFAEAGALILQRML